MRMNDPGLFSTSMFVVQCAPIVTRSTPVSFLDLPRGVRINIYKRLLVLRHPIYIFQEPNSLVESFAPDKPFRWLTVLYTKRHIYTESGSVLYDCIGPMNAASLSHLGVNFPVAEHIKGRGERVELRTDSLQSVRLYQDKYVKLSTLELVVHYKNSSFFREPDDFLREALSLTDARLRAIPSLRKIIVRFVDFDGIPTASATSFMRELGWIVVLRNGIQQ
ncbi:hypothetical protein GQ44DRAFT_744885 [Phaeosphaeriaceae sp. PMI808]|nr:hypothetical protein GQ44DRAFT_744885 [Phaeosphaeriaceae sp. PMI808]